MNHGTTASHHQQRFTRRTVLRSAVGAIVVTSAGLLAGCGALGSANGGDEIQVEMNDDMLFDPDPVTVAVGTEVTFTNVSTAFVHTATCDPALAPGPESVLLPDGAEPWNSGNVQPGESWSRRFDTPGEYRYVCLPHEMAGMIGTLIVEDGE